MGKPKRDQWYEAYLKKVAEISKLRAENTQLQTSNETYLRNLSKLQDKIDSLESIIVQTESEVSKAYMEINKLKGELRTENKVTCELCRKPVDECECVDEIIICNKCKGTGHIQFYVGGPYSECKCEKCDVCKGSGKMLQKINTTKMPYIGKPKYTKI